MIIENLRRFHPFFIHTTGAVSLLPQAGKGAADNAKTYEWCSDQMKAIRQDLTLQNIKHAFAAEVYESHARMALEKVDYSNYKQCQASLQGLYADVTNKYSLQNSACFTSRQCN